MRHRIEKKRLGRTTSHRRATLNALSNALIKHKHIRTTLAKAKALRPYIEPLITRAKESSDHNQRIVFSKLFNKETTKILFETIAPAAKERNGGYTRILKLGRRKGDGAEIAYMELVDFGLTEPSTTPTKKRGRKTTRRSGSRRKKNNTSKTS